MLAVGPRGRIIALDVLSVLPSSPLTAQWMIAVKTTRFDDGHAIAWHVEQDYAGRCWPTKTRLDPSLYSNESIKSMKAMGIGSRWSLSLGPKPMCLDDLESICLRSPMPDEELGEDHGSWCLDILFKLERLQILAKGQALQLESYLGAHPGPGSSPSFNDHSDLVLYRNHTTPHSKGLRSTSDALPHTVALYPPERPLTPESRSITSHALNQFTQNNWSPVAIPASSLMV